MSQETKPPTSKWRGWLAKKAKKLAISAAVAVVLALGIRVSVAEVFYAPSDAAAPEVPRNSRVLVYKLAGSFKPHDIIVYRTANGVAMLGRIESADATSVTVSRAGSEHIVVPMHDVVGRVVLGTR